MSFPDDSAQWHGKRSKACFVCYASSLPKHAPRALWRLLLLLQAFWHVMRLCARVYDFALQCPKWRRASPVPCTGILPRCDFAQNIPKMGMPPSGNPNQAMPVPKWHSIAAPCLARCCDPAHPSPTSTRCAARCYHCLTASLPHLLAIAFAASLHRGVIFWDNKKAHLGKWALVGGSVGLVGDTSRAYWRILPLARNWHILLLHRRRISPFCVQSAILH